MSYSGTSNSEARVNTYREYNRRCRTCGFANQDRKFSWFCRAKQTRYDGYLHKTRIKGVSCKLYESRKIGDDWYE